MSDDGLKKYCSAAVTASKATETETKCEKYLTLRHGSTSGGSRSAGGGGVGGSGFNWGGGCDGGGGASRRWRRRASHTALVLRGGNVTGAVSVLRPDVADCGLSVSGIN